MPSQVSSLAVTGIALLIVGAILSAVSFIPIPYVENVPRTETGITTTPRWVVVNETWLEETFVVQPGDANAYCGSFPSGTTLYITVEVLSGGNRDVNFWVMDESEWRVFKAGGSFYYYTTPSRQRVTEASITWNPPSNKRICFVFDNTFSIITSKTVYAKIVASHEEYTYVTTTYTTTIYEPTTKYQTLSYLLAPGVVMLAVGAGLFIASRHTSPRLKPAGAQLVQQRQTQ
jgi:hypothetical protein